jgi:nucleoside-diphosphate-sugar epimerase
MTLLVTGAMGHVGYELARRAAPHRRLIAQYNKTFRPVDAEALGPNVTWVACDLTDAGAVERLCGDHGVDACVHLAAVANDMYARPDPAAAFRTNVGAVVNLLDTARRGNWRRLIYCSTGSVFKNVDPARTITEGQPVDTDEIYGSTKACGEVMTTAFRAQYGLDAATVRISRIYGPPITECSIARGAIPSILIGALKGEPRHDPSGGDSHAGFTYIDDVTDGLLAAVAVPKLNHAIYHLAPPRNYAISEIAEAVRALVPGIAVEVGPGLEPWDRSAPMRGPMDSARFTADTGFRTRFSLVDGLKAYADWLRPHIG